MQSVTHTLIDNSAEVSTTRFFLPDITAANYDTITGNGVAENVGELRLAVATVSLCNFVRHTVVAEVYPETGSPPADPYAQRELKLLVTYIDDVTSKKYTVSIPGPDLATLAQTGTDVVDHTSNVSAVTLVQAMETYAVSPDGNAITVIGMRIVGRNV